MSKRIPLTRGKFTIVDNEDYEWLSQWKWYYSPSRKTAYATTMMKRGGRRQTTYMHKLILVVKKGMRVAHLNGSGLDNRRSNLRECSRSEIQRLSWARSGRSSRSKGIICESESTEYRAWASLTQRCTNLSNPAYKNYGGRGIQVCERWRTYANFLKDMGRRPANKDSIDRIDNDGDYEPDNCRWATWATQSANRRPGSPRPDSIASIARNNGLTKNRLYSRINKGMSAEEAIADVKKPSMSELARRAGMSRQILWHRLNVQGMGLDVALSAPVRGR